MREDWTVKPLGEIGKVSMCKRILKKQTNPDNGIPFYKIGTFGKVANAFIPEEIYNEYKSKYSFPKKGDVLLSASGTIGRRVTYDGMPAYFQDSNIVWIDNDEKAVLNEYLYEFYGYCDLNPSKGATISRLYNDDLRKIQIPIPPHKEQKQIVAILDKAFTAIDQAQANIQQNIQNAQDLFQSKLNQIFSQRGEGWEEKTLGDICDKTKNINWKENLDTQFQYVDLSSVSRDTLSVTDSSSITHETAPSRAKKIVEVGDVIFATTRPTLRRATIILEELSGHICSTGFVVLRPKINTDPEWIFYYLLTSNFMNRMESLQRGASYPAVTDNDVKGSYLSVPKLKDIEKKKILIMNNLHVKTDELVLKYKNKLNQLDELKKSLLQKAFNGELTQDKQAA